ncbi:hypothetical protein CupriaWKF_27975 [Cupriavidus sp. WKF15]|nr:hypothetical protein [Cupriavidus sp. WKF15]WER48612.1 hypothetical protein CupriaWKF_27975 [Cupriavidus sp. WKF15]
MLAWGTGLAIGVVVHGITSTAKVREREQKSPVRYLSEAEKRFVVITVGA